MAAHVDEQGLPGDDIEKQSSPSLHQSSPKSTPATPNPIVPADKLDDKADGVTTGSKADGVTTSSKAVGVTKKVGKFIVFVIFCIIILVAFPFVLAYVIASVCLIGSIRWPNKWFSSNKNGSNSSSDSKTKGIHSKIQEFMTTKEKILRLDFIATMRLGCLALSWLVVNLCVPSLSSLTLIGCPLWKWSLLVVIILLGYPFAALTFAIAPIIAFHNGTWTKKPNFWYFLMGLLFSFIGLLHFALILLMWLLYFRTDRGLNPSTKFDKFGTWTFVSLLVGASLWMLKSAALLEWKAKAVYKRFKGRILTAGFQLYFLQIVTSKSCPCDGRLLPWRAYGEQDLFELLRSINDEETMEATDEKSIYVPISIISQIVTIVQLQYMVDRIARLAKVIQREDDGIPKIVAQFSIEGSTDFKRKDIMNYFKLDENEWYLLLEELDAKPTSEDITCDAFRKWMVDARKNCLTLGYTLIDAFAMVSILNRVITGFLVGMVILIWLLVTELATTKALVVIASPILALSFVFGDTCRAFFQGFIFSFVIHPYDVGDRCIIDEKKLEVKRINILTTTFQRIGTKEKMMYPNASLATKLITNLEGESNLTDMIELAPSTTMSKILKLKEDLESFFEEQRQKGKHLHGSYDEVIDVTLEEIGSNIKVRISLNM